MTSLFIAQDVVVSGAQGVCYWLLYLITLPQFRELARNSQTVRYDATSGQGDIPPVGSP
jgi:hypothetical protein